MVDECRLVAVSEDRQTEGGKLVFKKFISLALAVSLLGAPLIVSRDVNGHPSRMRLMQVKSIQ